MPYFVQNLETYKCSLVGKSPSHRQGTQVELYLSSDSRYDASQWRLHIESISGTSVTVSITAPSTCPVGKWYMNIELVHPDGNTRPNANRYKHKDPIYVLFNPWNRRMFIIILFESITSVMNSLWISVALRKFPVYGKNEFCCSSNCYFNYICYIYFIYFYRTGSYKTYF